MSQSTTMMIYFGFLAIIVVLFAFAIWRGRKVIAANERIVENQTRLVEQTERNLVLQERQAAAFERVATAMEEKVKN